MKRLGNAGEILGLALVALEIFDLAQTLFGLGASFVSAAQILSFLRHDSVAVLIFLDHAWPSCEKGR